MTKTTLRQLAVAAVIPLMARSARSSQGGRPADTGNAAGRGQVTSTARIKVALLTHAAPGDTFRDNAALYADTRPKTKESA